MIETAISYAAKIIPCQSERIALTGMSTTLKIPDTTATVVDTVGNAGSIGATTVQGEGVDTYTRRDSDDAEWESGREYRAHTPGNPAVVVRVISSTGSTKPATTYKCQVVRLTNPETVGADLAFVDDGPQLLATGIGGTRPLMDATHAYLVVTIDGRNILLNY